MKRVNRNNYIFILLFLVFFPIVAVAENIVFSKEGTLSKKLFNNEKFLSLNKVIIECEPGKFVFKEELLDGIEQPSYHNIVGEDDSSCIYTSNYPCGAANCFASCKLSSATLDKLQKRFEASLILSVKGSIDGDDILNISELDTRLYESFIKECEIKEN